MYLLLMMNQVPMNCPRSTHLWLAKPKNVFRASRRLVESGDLGTHDGSWQESSGLLALALSTRSASDATMW